MSKDRQHNDRKEMDKRINNDLQNITHKIIDRVTRNPLKAEGEPRCSEKVSSSCSTSGTHRVRLCFTINIEILLSSKKASVLENYDTEQMFNLDGTLYYMQ